MTNLQLSKLHSTRAKLQKLSGGAFDRAAYDMVLMNCGGVDPRKHGGEISSKFLTNLGFERVMVFLEEEQAKLDPTTGTYWRDQDRHARAGYLTTRQEWEIHRIFDQLRTAGCTYELSWFVRQFSEEPKGDPHRMKSYEAQKLIETLKSIGDRHCKQELEHGR